MALSVKTSKLSVKEGGNLQGLQTIQKEKEEAKQGPQQPDSMVVTDTAVKSRQLTKNNNSPLKTTNSVQNPELLRCINQNVQLSAKNYETGSRKL